MAQRVVTQLISDLSGDEIADGTGETVEFTYRGMTYQIDLTDDEAAGFDKAIEIYVANARRVSGRRSTSARNSRGSNAKEIRAWARSQGIDVPERGRIPGDVVDRYRAAQ